MSTKTAPPIVGTTFGIDAPRARKTDPTTSQVAADATSRSIKETKRRVLRIVAFQGPIIGAELNDLYDLTAASNGWDPNHVDTPRKRAGELAADGFLEVIGERVNPKNHLPEAEYRITDRGRAAIASGVVR